MHTVALHTPAGRLHGLLVFGNSMGVTLYMFAFSNPLDPCTSTTHTGTIHVPFAMHVSIVSTAGGGATPAPLFPQPLLPSGAL